MLWIQFLDQDHSTYVHYAIFNAFDMTLFWSVKVCGVLFRCIKGTLVLNMNIIKNIRKSFKKIKIWLAVNVSFGVQYLSFEKTCNNSLVRILYFDT